MLEEKSAERTAIKLSMAQSPTSRGSQKDKMIVYLREMTYINDQQVAMNPACSTPCRPLLLRAPSTRYQKGEIIMVTRY